MKNLTFVFIFFATACHNEPAQRTTGSLCELPLIQQNSGLFIDTNYIYSVNAYNSEIYDRYVKVGKPPVVLHNRSAIYFGSWAKDSIGVINNEEVIILNYHLSGWRIRTDYNCGIRVCFKPKTLLRKNYYALAFELKIQKPDSTSTSIVLETSTFMNYNRYRTWNIYQISQEWNYYILPIEWENDGIPRTEDFFIEAAISLQTPITLQKNGVIYLRSLIALKDKSILPAGADSTKVVIPGQKDILDLFKDIKI